MSEDITIRGVVTGQTEMAWFFRCEDALSASDIICLPKSQVAIVKGAKGDEVSMPIWLARKKGLY